MHPAWDRGSHRLIYLPPFDAALVRYIERHGVRNIIRAARRRGHLDVVHCLADQAEEL